MAVNIHITIIELNALHTKRQNLFQELDAVIHLLMEAKHWGLRKSRNRSEERFSRNAETELVCRLLREKKQRHLGLRRRPPARRGQAGLEVRPARPAATATLFPYTTLFRSPSTYISPLSNSTPCIRKDRISSKSLMRLSICLWKPSIGD